MDLLGFGPFWTGALLGALFAYFLGARIVAGVYGLLPIGKGE